MDAFPPKPLTSDNSFTYYSCYFIELHIPTYIVDCKLNIHYIKKRQSSLLNFPILIECGDRGSTPQITLYLEYFSIPILRKLRKRTFYQN